MQEKTRLFDNSEIDSEQYTNYLGTIKCENKYNHFYSFYGSDEFLFKSAVRLSIELGGQFQISKNDRKDSTHIIVSCTTDDWENKIQNPIIFNTLKELKNAK